jgi:hypothetical protein
MVGTELPPVTDCHTLFSTPQMILRVTYHLFVQDHHPGGTPSGGRLDFPANGNVFLSDEQPMKDLQLCREAIEKHVLAKEVSADDCHGRLRKVLATMMIRRTLSSRISLGSGKMIGGDILPSH